jgi:hypothetical protein
MLGLNRTGSYLHGFPITLPHTFGNPVTVTDTNHIEPQPMPVGTGNILTLPVIFGSPVNLPHQFGNPIPYVPPSSASGFELENGSGVILLENGDILLLEIQ